MLKKQLLVIIFFTLSNILFAAPGKWVGKNKEMISLYRKGKVKESYDFAYPNLKILQSEFAEEKKISSDAIMFLVNYGVISLKNKKLEDALEVLEFARDSKMMIASPNDPLFVIIYRNIAKIYDLLDKKEKAENIFLKAIDVKIVNKGEESIELVPLYVQLGNFYQLRKNQKALDVYEKALFLAKKNTGDEGILTADIHLVLGKYFLNLDEFNKAYDQLTLSLDIYRNNDAKNKISHSYDALGLLSQNKKNYQEAESHYRQALKFKKAILGDTSLEYAKTLNNLAMVYLNQDKNEAEALFNEALVICEKKQKNHPSSKLIIKNLIEFYDRKNNEKKLSEYNKMLERLS